MVNGKREMGNWVKGNGKMRNEIWEIRNGKLEIGKWKKGKCEKENGK